MNCQVHVWAPGLFTSTGGIQAFSRHFIDALSEEIAPHQVRVQVKNDLPESVLTLTNGCVHVDVYGHCSPPLRTSRFAFGCMDSAWRDRPDVIISTHLNFGPMAHLIRQSLGVPYVLVAHGIDAWRLNNWSRQHALKKANLVLAVSHYTRDWLVQETGLDEHRVQILPNTFSQQRFTIKRKSSSLLQKYGFTPENHVILTVCRLAEPERYKGYDQMIQALPQILRAVPHARYLLGGTGPDRTRVERLIAEVGVQDAVVLAGFIPDEDLAEHYNLCDIFAMPSKGEGFGIVYLEALACGKPVLAGNKDGSRDAVANGELGVLIDPDNITEIAAETIRILRHEHPNTKLFNPELLRKRVTELFGFEAFKRTVSQRLQPFLQNGYANRCSR